MLLLMMVRFKLYMVFIEVIIVVSVVVLWWKVCSVIGFLVLVVLVSFLVLVLGGVD